MTIAKLYPCLRYQDAPAMIEWLCSAFGFAKRVAYPAPNGSILHAELSIGDDILMLGSAGNDTFGVSPKALGKVTGTTYVATSDVDAHCAVARAAGAEVFRDPADTDYGSREYSCRDPEGHIWTFGTYRPMPGA